MAYFQDKEFAQYIRELPCCICGGGDWSMEKGSWCNQPSHIKAKGMGGANKQEHENLVPMCFKDHREFEGRSTEHKQLFKSVAKKVYKNYISKFDS